MLGLDLKEEEKLYYHGGIIVRNVSEYKQAKVECY